MGALFLVEHFWMEFQIIVCDLIEFVSVVSRYENKVGVNSAKRHLSCNGMVWSMRYVLQTNQAALINGPDENILVWLTGKCYQMFIVLGGKCH